MDNQNNGSEKTQRELLMENVLNNMVNIERFNDLLSGQERDEDYYLSFKETSRQNLQSVSEEKLVEHLKETAEKIKQFSEALDKELGERQIQREHSPIPQAPSNEFRPPELRDATPTSKSSKNSKGAQPSSTSSLVVTGKSIPLQPRGPQGKSSKG